MKLRDIFHLATSNLRSHFRRSLTVMLIMSVIFGLIFALNLWFQGVENSYLAFASRPTNGQVILSLSNHPDNLSPDLTPLASRAEIVADIEAHGGKVLGDTARFGMFGSIILPANLVQNNIELDPADAPADAAPVLASTFLGEQLLGQRFATDTTPTSEDYAIFRENLLGQTFTDQTGAKYYVVGFAPGNFHVANLSFKQLDRDNRNPLNPILNYISTPEGTPIVIDNGHRDLWQSGDSLPDDLFAHDNLLAVFADIESAYDFFLHGHAQFPNVDLPNRTYSARLIAGPSPEVQYIFRIIKLIINIISAALSFVSAIIIIFTLIRLLDQDRPNLTLYRRLGATSRQIRAIYLCYFLELIIGAALLTFALASLAVLSFSFLNQDLLSLQAMLALSLVSAPQVIWYGLNPTIFIALGAVILLTLPVICATIEKYARQDS